MPEPLTVRERITAIQQDMLNGGLSPDTVREHELKLSALSGNCAEERRTAELAFNHVLLACKKNGAANRARIEAECSEEYARFREAEDWEELVGQLIVTCRSVTRSLIEEMRMAAR